MPRALFAAAAIAAAVLLISCGSDGDGDSSAATPVAPTNGQIDVRSFEWGYEPSALLLTEGEQVRIVLENEGEIIHNIRIDGLDADALNSGDGGEVFVEADDGESGAVEFVPLEAGTFEFYCTIPNHRNLGMEGQVIVQAAP